MSRVLSALEEEILTLLKGTSAYGLEIIEAVNELSRGERPPVPGTYYPILKKLEDKGFITSHWGDSFVGARRKYYQITPHGTKALNQRREYREKLEAWTSQESAARPRESAY